MIPDLHRTGPTPIYQQIKDWVHQQIAEGHWPEHYKLRAEVDLAEALGVSRGTVRRAISELIDEGLLVSIHGRGTFVASKVLEQPLAAQLVGVSEDLISKGIPFFTKVLSKSVIKPSTDIASLLSVPPDKNVFALQRVRYVAGEPLVLLHNYVVYDRCPGIEETDFVESRLFQTIEEQYGLVLDWGQRNFEARTASDMIAEQLEVESCDPVMYLEQVVYLDDGAPIELSNVWFRADRFRLSATVKRGGAPNGRANLSAW